MPDFFEGEPADITWYPPVTEEKKKALEAWFPTRMPQASVDKIPGIIKSIEEKYGKKDWGIVGYCWGGKLTSLVSGPNTLFKVGAQCHPGVIIDVEDAKKITIPMCILASKDEPEEEIKTFEEALKVEKHVETFGDQIHGWMSARADLENEDVRKEYERGYRVLLGWFGKFL